MIDVLKLAMAGDIGELSITLPTLEELNVPEELIEAAEALNSCSDAIGLETFTLELLVRLLVYQDRQGWLARNPDLAKLLPRAS